MKIETFLATALITALFLMQTSLAHVSENEGLDRILDIMLETNKLNLVIYVSLFLGLVLLANVLLLNRMNEVAKKISFIFVSIIIAGTTAFLVISIVSLNILSVTGGPVHWHAVVEFEFCGIKYELPAKDIGVDKPLHTHGDQLVHVETTPLTYDDVKLAKFFEYIGGELTKTSLTIPTEAGLVGVRNGDLCDGRPGTLKMFVNGEPEPKMDDYVISPIEAGNIDRISFVFNAD